MWEILTDWQTLNDKQLSCCEYQQFTSKLKYKFILPLQVLFE